MPNESTPPSRDLPAEIEAALETVQQRWTELGRFDRTGDIFVAENAAEHLRQAIRAALDDRDTALREAVASLGCVETLRRTRGSGIRERYFITGVEVERLIGLLADNLIPRGGDER